MKKNPEAATLRIRQPEFEQEVFSRETNLRHNLPNLSQKRGGQIHRMNRLHHQIPPQPGKIIRSRHSRRFHRNDRARS